ncbi:kinase-like domain-containing protein [Crepidotus variabilis]|uniref:non-specific serine/threonine protein kinase n=1 Tax=Crepidotus variabilis TaxID=179855 RepID=A0A9P6EGK5_9AGAR|nr:kinase-like domain-containing protein [Crepidotus variabilis]
MSTKTSAAPTHPAVGTLIDGGSLELVEVLGVGGYGVVYRAIDTRQPSGPKSYAVKCLVSSGHQTPRQRQIHIREIALHQLASAHPGVVTLHRVVEEGHNTFIVMDYAPDHDLFTQILHSCRYLGDDALIKDIFLQLLDAVEYCHALGIYHRDLKPENILCFDDGLRIAITDFGLATTDKLSDEFRTGSVYHMSPECQGGEFAPTGNYSPMFNDIWSLGIILLNLATGRNPWKSATPGDPTFQAYLRDPMNFLPSVLPISAEVNEILIRMLEVDWRERMTLREVRYAIEEVTSFYSDGVVFEGSMARCPWESGMEIDSASSGTDEVEPQSPPAQSTCSDFPQDIADTHHQYTSAWSQDSSSDIVFAAESYAQGSSYGVPWTTRSSCGATWGALDTPAISSSSSEMDLFEATRTPGLTQSPGSSLPATPNSFDTTFGARLHPDAKQEQRSSGLALMINTNLARPRIYNYEAGDDALEASFSTHTSMMHTAIEYDPYSSMFYINSPIVRSPGGDKGGIIMPDSALTAVGEDKEMTSPSVWTALSATEMSSPSSYSESLASTSTHGEDVEFCRSASPSPEPNSSTHPSWSLSPATHQNHQALRFPLRG